MVTAEEVGPESTEVGLMESGFATFEVKKEQALSGSRAQQRNQGWIQRRRVFSYRTQT